ncbi:MAG: hypothetical protein GY862_23355 [Gammaproteobacteria bacterium]|nr:hypothetical protein [Gammaproteobacteria bacterium]
MTNDKRNIALLLCLLNGAVFACDDAKSYIRRHGGCAASGNERVIRANAVFDKIRAAANKKLWPEFAIVNKGPPNKPFLAVARKDNTILLSKSVTDLSYAGVSNELGDSRIAFIVGHELAHLANGDLLPKAFQGSAQKKPANRQDRNREIKADEGGFIYAAIAGFSVDKLLAEENGQTDFFIYWQKQTAAKTNDTHPNPEERARALTVQLQYLLENLSWFHFGVRLIHFNRCKEAVPFLRKFQKVFPAREVYNNLGYCHLQQGMEALGSDAYLYWLPSVLDLVSQADAFSLPPEQTLQETRGLADEANASLKKAVRQFKLAIETDPYYIFARVNLAVTQFYLGQTAQAHATAKKALELASDKKETTTSLDYRRNIYLKKYNLEIQGLAEVISYEEKGRRHLSATIAALEKLPAAPLSVEYNLARLRETGGISEAKKHWRKLAENAAKLPAPVRKAVCAKYTCPQTEKKPYTSWQIPVQPGAYLGNNAPEGLKKKNWKKTGIDFGPKTDPDNSEANIYRYPEGVLLELDGYAEMLVLKNVKDKTVSGLSEYCEHPLRQHPAVNGRLWSCKNWTALAIDDKVREVWIVPD